LGPRLSSAAQPLRNVPRGATPHYAASTASYIDALGPIQRGLPGPGTGLAARPTSTGAGWCGAGALGEFRHGPV